MQIQEIGALSGWSGGFRVARLMAEIQRGVGNTEARSHSGFKMKYAVVHKDTKNSIRTQQKRD